MLASVATGKVVLQGWEVHVLAYGICDLSEVGRLRNKRGLQQGVEATRPACLAEYLGYGAR